MYSGYAVNIWDVGGQKTLRSYWRNYYETTDGLVWVVDSADHRRLEDCKEELHALLSEEKLVGATLLILANKQDIPGAMSKEQVAQILNLVNMKTRHWHIEGCSAVTGDGLLRGLIGVLRTLDRGYICVIELLTGSVIFTIREVFPKPCSYCVSILLADFWRTGRGILRR